MLHWSTHRTESKRETSIHGRHILSLLWEIEFCKTDTGRTVRRGNGRRTNEWMRKEKRRKEKRRKENLDV